MGAVFHHFPLSRRHMRLLMEPSTIRLMRKPKGLRVPARVADMSVRHAIIISASTATCSVTKSFIIALVARAVLTCPVLRNKAMALERSESTRVTPTLDITDGITSSGASRNTPSPSFK